MRKRACVKSDCDANATHEQDSEARVRERKKEVNGLSKNEGIFEPVGCTET